MPEKSKRLPSVMIAAILLIVAGVGIFLYVKRQRDLPLPGPGDARYESYVSAFQLGNAYLDAGLTKQAQEQLSKAIDLIPQEPAAWANRAIMYLRQRDFPKAAADLARARELASNNPDLDEISCLLSESQNKLAEAKDYIQKAIAAEPNNVRRLFRLSELIAKIADPDADKQRLALFLKILEVQPDNLPVWAAYTRLVVHHKDAEALQWSLEKMTTLTGNWQERTVSQLSLMKKDAAAGQWDALEHDVQVMHNLMLPELGYATRAAELAPIDASIGVLLQYFVKLKPASIDADEPDLQVTFKNIEFQPAPNVKTRSWSGVAPIWLDSENPPAVFVYDSQQVRRADGTGSVLPFPSGVDGAAPGIHSVLGIDWDNDYKMDIVLAGSGGLRFHHQKEDGTFEDLTAQTSLPADVLAGNYFGAWAVDIDFDGDLDIVVARRKGPPVLLRNNFNGTFTAQAIFPDTADVRAFTWLDIDNDGASDAAMLDGQGRLHVFMNQRSGIFVRRAVPDPQQVYYALAVADVNDDGVFDLIAVSESRSLVRISDRDKGRNWDVADLAKVEEKLPLHLGDIRLIACDLDNNGAVDLVLRTPTRGVAWLAGAKGGFTELPAAMGGGVADWTEIDENGWIDFLGIDEQNHLKRQQVVGTRGYQWFDIKPRSTTKVVGDNRINSFGVGGQIELRAGLMVAKQPMDRPTIHFGLGTHKTADLVRCEWPNGTFQFEFEMNSGDRVKVEQRLKGSCPFLYAWNGDEMAFVADFCWSTPLGMYINGQDKGGFLQTTDWVKIRGEQLVPRDGIYDVRVNANLWETHFLDQLSLMVVDHPPGTEMHVDERFFLQPTQPTIYLTGPAQSVAAARDHEGQDVTEIVRRVDGNYLDCGKRGVYQGVANDHWVEVDLGDDAPTTGTVYLLARGWIHPTDSSINFALEQNGTIKPAALSLEIPDGAGGWKVGRGALGFPAGKNKTCVIRLDGIEGDRVSRRFRLRTNLEIFWDALQYATGLDSSKCRRRMLPAQTADLSFRGMVRMTQASPSHPELPHYNEVLYRVQYWRDLIGFHTRFGDVRELIEKSDDRFVIMNAGDEISLSYMAPPSPSDGWQRDFIWICDGWVKDGDLNTRWGKTVLPLPYHDMPTYDKAPGRLEDDPVYRRFPDDWVKYHTRYVTPAQYERGLRGFRSSR